MSDLAVNRSRWHRLVESILPWYDPEQEAARDARSEAIHERGVAARINSERIRQDYAAAAKRIQRR